MKQTEAEQKDKNNIQMITIHTANSISNCTLKGLQSPDLTEIVRHEQYTAFDNPSTLPANGVFRCVFPSDETSLFTKKSLLAIYVPFSPPEDGIINIQSNRNEHRQPALKCTTASTSLKWTQQPYVCEAFNDINTIDDTFHLFVNGIEFDRVRHVMFEFFRLNFFLSQY